MTDRNLAGTQTASHSWHSARLLYAHPGSDLDPNPVMEMGASRPCLRHADYLIA